MKNEILSLNDIHEITNLFLHKKWEMDDKNNCSLYNRFINLFKRLSSEQKKLFIKLSYSFQIISIQEYQYQLLILMESVCKKYCTQRQEIYIMPIKCNNHQGNIKSSDFVTYLCTGTQRYYRDIISNKKIIIIGSYTQLEEKKNKFINRPLFLIDDFIGSGKYAITVVRELIELGIDKNNIIILSLYLHKNGADNLKLEGINYETNNYVDNMIETLLTTAEIRMLEEMENNLKIKPTLQFGYNNSGSLISLIRTPNNTIPIFWKDKYKTALFPRK